MNEFVNFHIPKFNPLDIKTPNFELRDPDLITKEILSFLEKTNDAAQKQFNISKNLIIATIIIMIFQIGIAIWTNSVDDSKQNNLNNIIEMQSKQSEVISQMSLNLLDLQNQVRTLEKENSILSDKKNK